MTCAPDGFSYGLQFDLDDGLSFLPVNLVLGDEIVIDFVAPTNTAGLGVFITDSVSGETRPWLSISSANYTYQFNVQTIAVRLDGVPITHAANFAPIDGLEHSLSITALESCEFGSFLRRYNGTFPGAILLKDLRIVRAGVDILHWDPAASNRTEAIPVLTDTAGSFSNDGTTSGMATDGSNWVKIACTTTPLGPESKIGIETGDLLPPEAKVNIGFAGLITPIPPPPASLFPLNYARIGYDNALINGSATAISDNVGSANMLTPSTYDKWRPTADGLALLTGVSQPCNYVGIAAHNLGSDGVTLTVNVSNGGASTAVYSQLVTNNKAIFIRFATATYDRVEISITGSTNPEIGVVFLGLELEMMRPIFSGHRPSVLSATDVMTPQISDGGQFLGKQIVRQGYGTSADFQHLTDEWYRTTFQPFVEHAKTRPYFWAWNLLESPDDVVYGWTNGNISPSYMGIRNWLEVSFEIEAHA